MVSNKCLRDYTFAFYLGVLIYFTALECSVLTLQKKTRQIWLSRAYLSTWSVRSFSFSTYIRYLMDCTISIVPHILSFRVISSQSTFIHMNITSYMHIIIMSLKEKNDFCSMYINSTNIYTKMYYMKIMINSLFFCKN